MPQSAAQRLADAERRMNDHSLSATEHEVAAAEYVEAHQELSDKLGYERRSSRGTRIGTAIAALLLLAVVVSMVLNFSYSVTASNTADTAKETAKTARQAVAAIRAIQHENITAQLASCRRGNKTRVGDIRNLHSDVSTLTGQLNLWEALLAVTPPAQLEQTPESVRDALSDNLDRLRRGIHRKEHAIEVKIASQAPVAVKPGSPRADCRKVVHPHTTAFALPALPRWATPLDLLAAG